MAIGLLLVVLVIAVINGVMLAIGLLFVVLVIVVLRVCCR